MPPNFVQTSKVGSQPTSFFPLGLCSPPYKCPVPWEPWEPHDIRVATTAREEGLEGSGLAQRQQGKAGSLQKLFGCCLPAREVSVISRTLSTFSWCCY